MKNFKGAKRFSPKSTTIGIQTGRHRTTVHERVPSRKGFQFVNKLPNLIEITEMSKALYTTLTYETFKSVDEFMTHNLSGNMVGKSGQFKNKLEMWEN